MCAKYAGHFFSFKTAGTAACKQNCACSQGAGAKDTTDRCDDWLERKPPAYLDDTLGARRRRDLAIVGRCEACGGVRETHEVEDIGGLAAELEDNSMLELDVVKETKVDIFESGSIQGVAAYVAVRATRADAPGHARPVIHVCCRVEPFTGRAVRGTYPAAVSVERYGLAGNRIRALVVGAVEALVGAGGRC